MKDTTGSDSDTEDPESELIDKLGEDNYDIPEEDDMAPEVMAQDEQNIESFAEEANLDGRVPSLTASQILVACITLTKVRTLCPRSSVIAHLPLALSALVQDVEFPHAERLAQKHLRNHWYPTQEAA